MIPLNGQVWETKSGNTVLIVERPTPNGVETGFIWFDPIDKVLCYATLMDQLSHRLNMNPAEWGIMMNEFLPLRVPA